MAQALVFSAMAGLLPAADARLVLIGVPDDAREALSSLTGHYTRLQSSLGEKAEGAFAVSFRTGVWPESPDTNLNLIASEKGDRVIRDALFTRQEANGQLLTGSAPVSSMGFQRLLRGGLTGEMVRLREDLRAGGSLLMLGSLAEPCCASGVQAIGDALHREVEGARIGAALESCVYQTDDMALCKAAMKRLDTHLDGLWLVGLPEDCQLSGEDPQICDWLAASGAAAFWQGMEGGYAFHAPMGALGFGVFGQDAERYRTAAERLIRAVWLSKAELLPYIGRVSTGANRLMARMPRWYTAWMGRGRAAADQLQTTQSLAESWRILGDAFLAWLDGIQRSAPYPMRLSEAVREGTAEAEAHYRGMLRNAGLLALMQYDADFSDLKDEVVIHRYSMADADGEATLKRIGEMENQMLKDKAVQQDLNLSIGGRAALRMMERVAAETQADADSLRQQVQEGRRRIERAEQLATIEEMPKVGTAKARLGRLERRLAALDGCARQAQGDLKIASATDQRLRPPSLPGADSAEPELFPPDVLQRLMRLEAQESKQQRQESQDLLTRWPWPDTSFRQAMSAMETADAAFPDAPGFARLLNRLLT